MKRPIIFLSLSLFLLPIVGSGTTPKKTPPASQHTTTNTPKIIRYKKGYRYNKNGWIYLHIEGKPFERGFQEGYLTAKELSDVIKLEKSLVFHETGKKWSFFREATLKMFAAKIPPEFMNEIKGIAAGATANGQKVSWQDVLTWNALDEVTSYWWPTVSDNPNPLSTLNSKSHCSAFLATGSVTKDGKIIIAHSSWDSYAGVQYDNIIVDVKPDKGHEFVMQSQIGYIDSFADWFETDAGLIGVETTFAGFNEFNPQGMPEFIRIRQAMQYSNNLDDFVKIMLKDNNGSNAASWLVGNTNNNTIMKFELGLKYHNIKKTKDGYFIGFNAPYDVRIRNLECSNTGFHDIRRHTGARRVRLDQLMQQYYGKIDLAVAKKVLADQYDVFYHKINPSSRTIAGHYELDDRAVMSMAGRPLPFQPSGAYDGKVTSAALAKKLQFYARFGSPDGMPFDANTYFKAHPQWKDYKPYIVNRPAEPWTFF